MNIALIPARSGSKGIKNKNIQILGGKPLIAWTIKVAHESQVFDKVIVSTDSVTISDIAKKYGAEIPFMRPSTLSEDNSTRNDVINHAFQQIHSATSITYLQPTSPFRSTSLLREFFHFAYSFRQYPSISISTVTSNPSIVYSGCSLESLKLIDEKLTDNRQDSTSKVYKLNGLFYFLTRDYWSEPSTDHYFDYMRTPFTKFFLTSQSANLTDLDIDSYSDLELARKVYRLFV